MMAEEIVKIEEISQLTDEKLKEALEHLLGKPVGPITSSNRELHEHILKRRLEGNTAETSDNNAGGGTVASGRSQKVFPEESDGSLASVQHNLEVSMFFGVFLPEAVDVTNDPENGPTVVVSQCAAAAAAGEVAGSSTSISAEKPSPYRGPKSQDLVKFRKSIEKGDAGYFNQCIDENPRYLVSSGDTPAILQEGFRYNALHMACRTNKPKFVAKNAWNLSPAAMLVYSLSANEINLSMFAHSQ
ncbi:Ankyrin repeat and LEM domain-containing protein 2-like 3 [Homarus americanus]|uniref:Ankyrin repeat and LEM domain-containing protein 2-like 3 n=1 Tax=Homarus americanus TaxID=6706 RepID=A0A8J5JNW8_HOMAM|nr:Ankyrin repeat and LEM domain-containing protein 2-like 3 [Homarus americanus]